MTEELKQVWVAAYLRNAHGDVLVRKRGAHCAIDPGFHGPPGGKVKWGETLNEALCRELDEETRLVALEWKLVQIYDTSKGICFLYQVLRWDGELTDEHGHGSWHWVDPAKLKEERVQGGLARWLGMDAPRCVEVLP